MLIAKRLSICTFVHKATGATYVYCVECPGCHAPHGAPIIGVLAGFFESVWQNYAPHLLSRPLLPLSFSSLSLSFSLSLSNVVQRQIMTSIFS
jgi:hypothetical protein